MSPRRKDTTPLRRDTFAPSSYKHHFVWSSFEQKADTVWNYQVKRKKSWKLHGVDFFISFIVANWRLCVWKLLVLVKFVTPIRISRTSLTKRFSLSSRTIVDIYSDNVWESRQCVIIQWYLIKWLGSTKINFRSTFASSTTCVCA